ncbi:MAG TPA: type III PLP-dependent enzyme [Stellaceae bacterium]|nr:type III PLP-dependent enzyme [Stellaceae bacterium]
MTDKIDRFLTEVRPETPCLVMDLDLVERAYRGLAETLPTARVFYAVKANPAPEILERLTRLGGCFDTASRGEIELVLAAGAGPERISFGNTIKKERDIAWAHAAGVRLYAFDCIAELEKIARAAPGAQVFCRILVKGEGAKWPLSKKFGCSPELGVELLTRARELGLEPYGVSFHVGSQQTDAAQWDLPIERSAGMFKALAEKGIQLKLVNLGGGFPGHHYQAGGVPPVAAYGITIMDSMTRHFGNDLPEMILEPGRGMVADAGVLHTEVVLVSNRDTRTHRRRWIYLDAGKFNGLIETLGEVIQYKIRTPHDGKEAGPVVLAGPTCDSLDILYEKADYRLPLDLAIGDTVQFIAVGAYCSSYASVGFNGFAPLKTYCV